MPQVTETTTYYPPTTGTDKPEAVDHPTHYQGAKFEVIDIIEDYKLEFCLGNAIKYILRAGKKPGSIKREDLDKAIWYLRRESQKPEREQD